MILFPFLKKKKKKKASRSKCSAGQIVSADVHCPKEKTAPTLKLSTCKFRDLNIFNLKWSMCYEWDVNIKIIYMSK